MTDFELGWVAGIIDGEGCIGLYRRTPVPGVNGGSWILHIKVASTTPTIVDRLKELVGGEVRKCKASKNEKWRQAYEWRMPHKGAHAFLESILPLLVEKQQQAELGILFLRTVGPSGKRVPEGIQEQREKIARELKELKHGTTCPA